MSDVYLSLTETPSVVTLSQPVIASSVAATVTVGNTVTVALDANSLSALENVTVTVGAAVSVSNFPSTQTIAGTVTVSKFDVDAFKGVIAEEAGGVEPVNGVQLGYFDVGAGFKIVNEATPLPISGTVTVGNLLSQVYDSQKDIYLNQSSLWYYSPSAQEHLQVQDVADSAGGPLPISGTVTIGNTVTIASLPNGALTTRFGSVATANLAFITSAVTNTSRKYLLAQNISAGTVTIGIGFSPTTTQGIQLTAGGGLTFDAFCPTGAVYWLGAVTGANYCLIEG